MCVLQALVYPFDNTTSTYYTEVNYMNGVTSGQWITNLWKIKETNIFRFQEP